MGWSPVIMYQDQLPTSIHHYCQWLRWVVAKSWTFWSAAELQEGQVVGLQWKGQWQRQGQGQRKGCLDLQSLPGVICYPQLILYIYICMLCIISKPLFISGFVELDFWCISRYFASREVHKTNRCEISAQIRGWDQEAKGHRQYHEGEQPATGGHRALKRFCQHLKSYGSSHGKSCSGHLNLNIGIFGCVWKCGTVPPKWMVDCITICFLWLKWP